MGLAAFNRMRREQAQKGQAETNQPDRNGSDEASLTPDDHRFNELVTDLDNLKAEDLKFVAAHLGIDYTKKDESLKKVKAFLGHKAD